MKDYTIKTEYPDLTFELKVVSDPRADYSRLLLRWQGITLLSLTIGDDVTETLEQIIQRCKDSLLVTNLTQPREES